MLAVRIFGASVVTTALPSAWNRYLLLQLKLPRRKDTCASHNCTAQHKRLQFVDSAIWGTKAIKKCTPGVVGVHFLLCVFGGVLLFHPWWVVSSALAGLASGFGMGPGVSLSLWPP